MSARKIRALKSAIARASGLRRLELEIRLQSIVKTMARRDYLNKRAALCI